VVADKLEELRYEDWEEDVVDGVVLAVRGLAM